MNKWKLQTDGSWLMPAGWCLMLPIYEGDKSRVAEIGEDTLAWTTTYCSKKLVREIAVKHYGKSWRKLYNEGFRIMHTEARCMGYITAW